eukprot:323339-Pyramimonas_sp.AAC.1
MRSVRVRLLEGLFIDVLYLTCGRILDRLNDIDHPEAEKPAKPAEKPPQKQAGRLLAESKKAIDAQQSNKTRSNLACLLSAFPVAAW